MSYVLGTLVEIDVKPLFQYRGTDIEVFHLSQYDLSMHVKTYSYASMCNPTNANWDG